ncbi:glycosyltransferase family 2 protein [Alkalihalobacterium chitinilyticum]|uniref:Glycosyltransferase n=1 Tax=Alkalihalobacterium chitinilyticum TaxID=2980103 RepID=A0ABT5VB44_9BACI|nr:glycosyltransferase [Alkalihalobacterium chitinilyticum]MDE5412671.1 glycosyltransferase [Alkalihalobacterium chitinilyticum]
MVSIITCTKRPERINDIFENYGRQVVKEKELIIVLNYDETDIKKWQEKAKQYSNVFIFQLPAYMRLGACLNYAIEKSNYECIAKFDDDDYYAPHYLTEALKAIYETNSDMVGKKNFYAYMKNKKALVLHTMGQQTLAGPTLVFKKSIFNKVKFSNKIKAGSDQKFQRDCLKYGYKLHSTSQYNFTLIRTDSKGHTWKISDEEFLRISELVTYTEDYEDYVKKDF